MLVIQYLLVDHSSERVKIYSTILLLVLDRALQLLHFSILHIKEILFSLSFLVEDLISEILQMLFPKSQYLLMDDIHFLLYEMH